MIWPSDKLSRVEDAGIWSRRGPHHPGQMNSPEPRTENADQERFIDSKPEPEAGQKSSQSVPFETFNGPTVWPLKVGGWLGFDPGSNEIRKTTRGRRHLKDGKYYLDSLV